MNPTTALPPLDRDAVVGCLLGQAVGDMMVLPAENLSARRIAKWFPKLDRPRFLFGHGMGSDDTEHACMTANALLRCGGDTDTVAAITGALVGTRIGKAGIPTEWLDRWCDWPRSIRWIEKLGERLAEGKWRTAPHPAVGLAWWAIPFRNLFFFLVVLCHAVRRLFPPY